MSLLIKNSNRKRTDQVWKAALKALLQFWLNETMFRGGLMRHLVSPRAQAMAWGQGTEQILRNSSREEALEAGMRQTTPNWDCSGRFTSLGVLISNSQTILQLWCWGTAVGCRSLPDGSTFPIPGEICTPCQSLSRATSKEAWPRGENFQSSKSLMEKSHWTIPIIKSILTSVWLKVQFDERCKVKISSAVMKCCRVGGYCLLRIYIYLNLSLKALVELIKMYMLKPPAMSPPGEILIKVVGQQKTFPDDVFHAWPINLQFIQGKIPL